MYKLHDSHFDDFARWYLEREHLQKGRRSVPQTASARRWRMRLLHFGKIQPWFSGGARWSVQRLADVSELEQLLLTKIRWLSTLKVVPAGRPRLLGEAARRASALIYRRFDVRDREKLGRQADVIKALGLENVLEAQSRFGLIRNLSYFDRHVAGSLRLTGADRIVLRTPTRHEREEMARQRISADRLCLHDGHGRLLSYVAAVQMGLVPFQHVDAFVAEELSEVADEPSRPYLRSA